MVDFEGRTRNGLISICETLDSDGNEELTFTIHIDPNNGHAFADIYGDEGNILHYRAKGIDELSRQVEAVVNTIKAIGRMQ